MTQVVTSLTIETDLIGDAIDRMVDIHAALARRHGDAFRTLERRIETVVETGVLGDFRIHAIGDGHMVAGVPQVLAGIIQEAAALGV